jgi:hypothetical protein
MPPLFQYVPCHNQPLFIQPPFFCNISSIPFYLSHIAIVQIIGVKITKIYLAMPKLGCHPTDAEQKQING